MGTWTVSRTVRRPRPFTIDLFTYLLSALQDEEAESGLPTTEEDTRDPRQFARDNQVRTLRGGDRHKRAFPVLHTVPDHTPVPSRENRNPYLLLLLQVSFSPTWILPPWSWTEVQKTVDLTLRVEWWGLGVVRPTRVQGEVRRVRRRIGDETLRRTPTGNRRRDCGDK